MSKGSVVRVRNLVFIAHQKCVYVVEVSVIKAVEE